MSMNNTLGPGTSTLKRILSSKESHWVGDGFPVRTLFFYQEDGQDLSPFLLLDYAGPREFPATESRLGVGPHPHRGFETVTIVYSGEVEHRDSSGGGGHIGPGDVQWMTAASGLIHEEFHGREYARRGGRFEMVQLWVNLPAKFKMTPPRYQAITRDMIPVVNLNDGAASLRIIAGQYGDTQGPANSFSPVNVWDLEIHRDTSVSIDVPDAHTKLLVVLQGTVRIDDNRPVNTAEVAMFERNGDQIRIHADKGVKALLLSGEPLGESIVGYGPFVMNTQAEIHQAITDFQNGKLGQLA